MSQKEIQSGKEKKIKSKYKKKKKNVTVIKFYYHQELQMTQAK